MGYKQLSDHGCFFSLNSFFSQSSYKKVLEQQFKVKQYQMLVYISDTLEQSMQSIELLSRSTVNNYSIINNILNYKRIRIPTSRWCSRIT